MLRTRKQLKTKKARMRRLRLESLEGRRLLAADVGVAAGEWTDDAFAPEELPQPAFETTAVEASYSNESIDSDILICDPPEMVLPGSLEDPVELEVLDTIDIPVDESVESAVVMELAAEESLDLTNDPNVYLIDAELEASALSESAESESEAGSEDEADVESESNELRMSLNAATLNWTFGNFNISAENFKMQLFVEPESPVETNVIDTQFVEDNLNNAGDDLDDSESNIDETDEETSHMEDDLVVCNDVIEDPVDEVEAETGESPDADPPAEEPIDESSEDEAAVVAENVDEPVLLDDEASEETNGDAQDDGVTTEVTTIEAESGTTVNVQVTVNVGDPPVAESPVDEANEDGEASDDEAELTLDVIEQVLNDDGFVLVALPTDDLQALLNNDFENTSFDDIVLLESPPETIVEEVVESELPEQPETTPTDEADSVADDAVEVVDETEAVDETEVDGETETVDESIPVDMTEHNEEESSEIETPVDEPSDETPEDICATDDGEDSDAEAVDNSEVDDAVIESVDETDSEVVDEQPVDEPEPADETDVVDETEVEEEATQGDESEANEHCDDEQEVTAEEIENELEMDPTEEVIDEVESTDSETEEATSDDPCDDMAEVVESPESETDPIDELGPNTDAELVDVETPAEDESIVENESIDVTDDAAAVSVVNEMYGFVELLVGDMEWNELRIEADSLALTSPNSEMLFTGFELVLMNDTSSASVASTESTAIADVDETGDSDLDDPLVSNDYEQDIDSAICVWDPLESCLDTLDGVFA